MRYLVMGLAAALTLASVGALAQTPETMAVPADYRQWETERLTPGGLFWNGVW